MLVAVKFCTCTCTCTLLFDCFCLSFCVLVRVGPYIRLKAMFRAASFGEQFALPVARHLDFLFFVIIVLLHLANKICSVLWPTNRNSYMVYRRRHFQWLRTTSNRNFKTTPLFDAEYLRNGTRYRHSYDKILRRTYTRPTHGCHFEWLWMILSDFAKYSVTLNIMRSVCDSWASCTDFCHTDIGRWRALLALSVWSDDQCVAGWTQPRRDLSMSGAFYDRAFTLPDCQEACAQRFPLCVAINVNPLPNSLINCYLVPQLQPLTATPNVNNYEVIVSRNCNITSTYSIGRSGFDIHILQSQFSCNAAPPLLDSLRI